MSFMADEPQSVSVDDAQSRLRELIRRLDEGEHALRISEDGDDRAVLISTDEYQRLLETVEFLKQTGQGLADVAAGRTSDWANVRDELLQRLNDRESPTTRADSA